MDWKALFVPQIPLLETFMRGSVVYLSLFLLLRVILKRESGSVGITDLLVLVLLADAAQNAMSGDYQTITDGLLLVLTIIFWSYTLNWLGYHFPAFQWLVHPPPLMLVKDGQLLYRNMRKEFITQEELRSIIRQQGLEDFSQVKDAFIEGDGQISVISYDQGQKAPKKRQPMK